MIDDSILKRIGLGVCSIGYLIATEADLKKNPELAFEAFEIIGTGFLVRENTAVTNRHVLLALTKAQQDQGFTNDEIMLSFVYPRAGGFQTAHCRYDFMGAVANPELDVGFIDFRRRPEPMPASGHRRLIDSASGPGSRGLRVPIWYTPSGT